MPPYQRENGQWYSSFWAADPTTPGARRRYRQPLGDVRTRKEAEAAERRLHAEIEAQAAGRPATSRAGPSRSESPGPPVVPDLPSASFSGLAAKWLEVAVAPKRKPKTYQFYEYICRVWLVPYFGDREASSITPVDLEALQAHIARTPRRKNNEAGEKAPPGPKTNNEILGCLSSMLATAKRWRYLRSNPCDDVDRMAVPRARLAYYNAHDTARWLATCQQIEPDWYAFFLAGFRTGLREGELFALRVDDVDLDARQLTVRRTYGAAAEREEGTGRAVPVYLEGTPKSGNERVVGISGMLVDVLRGHLGMRKAGHVWSRRARNDGDAHLRLSNIVGPWRRVTEAAGLPAYSIHAMRHSFASQLVMAGVPLTHVQALLGHSTIKMTERYAHLAPGFASGHVDVLDTVPVTPGRPNSTSGASRPNKVVGVTGFEPVTPTV